MLQACLASVAAGGDVDRVIVVDNGANAEGPIDIECVRPSRNLGFGGGANAGFRRAAALRATAIALINDDVVVEPGWLRPLIAARHDDAAVGAVQPKLLMAGSDPARVNSVGVEIDA